ncbi:MAG: dicarboxylate/amino acid:cation symporter [Succinivibrio sp.]|nr:dicarboxylate/amino acid:cation symporter [Succinivibrio sp.]
MKTTNTTRVETAAAQAMAQVSRQKKIRQAALYLGALILGAVLGALNISQLNAVADFIATVFTRLFSFVAVPVIALSLLNTLAKLGHGTNSGRIFGHTVFYTLLTTILAAVIALILFIVIAPANVPSALVGDFDPSSVSKGSYSEYIITVIPNNLLAPFVSGNVLSILLIAAALGLGLASLPHSDRRTALVHFFSGLQDLLFVLIHWLIAILPLGILAFTAQLVAQIEAGIIIGGIASYFGTVIGANLLQMFIILPLLLLLRGLNPLRIARGMLPALAVALFSKSSAGTLPVTMASAEDNLQVDRRISRFVLPICTTINMNGCAAFILLTSLYLLQNAGVEITGFTLISWVFIATFAAIGNAGVPMGCYFLTLSLVSSMGIPVQLMGIILPVYAVIDMIETSLNVWSDSCVCNIVDKELKTTLGPDTEEAN